MRTARLYRLLLAFATVLAFVVVVLGAYVRLSAAGLGCPDWPGCYGHLTVAGAEAEGAALDATFPNQPLQPGKAMKEMVHRYAAGTLGLLVLIIAVLAWRLGRDRGAATLLAVLILFQALLGMWTVTMKLKPVVVTAHLAGGMSVLALLWWLWLGTRRSSQEKIRAPVGWRILAVIALCAVALQIVLGGWTSSHYAGLACSGFPTCNGQWWPAADYASGFGSTTIDAAGRVAIQWLHRLGALVSTGVLLAMVVACLRCRDISGVLLLFLLLLQLTLGVVNVLTGLPLVFAAAHNAVAALLLLTVVALVHRFRGRPNAIGEGV